MLCDLDPPPAAPPSIAVLFCQAAFAVPSPACLALRKASRSFLASLVCCSSVADDILASCGGTACQPGVGFSTVNKSDLNQLIRHFSRETAGASSGRTRGRSCGKPRRKIYFVMVEVSEEADVGMQLELQFVPGGMRMSNCCNNIETAIVGQ